MEAVVDMEFGVYVVDVVDVAVVVDMMDPVDVVGVVLAICLPLRNGRGRAYARGIGSVYSYVDVEQHDRMLIGWSRIHMDASA
ncbi:hypothetical protein PtrV1_12096 [Pyrenophora tritici-repentis]|nr:hypothetical protein PtrV1_12096 [Pyrenophora tritici-repentis]KAF7444890.1 hypothetical protein A1F99_114430 [Pyrenophora tritici-repentis]